MSTAMAMDAHLDPKPGEAAPGKIAMWLFLATEIMFFAGLLGSYIVLRMAHPQEFNPDWLEHRFVRLSVEWSALNTVVLIFSSLTMALAVQNSHEGNDAGVRKFMFLTFLMGVCFCMIKSIEYSAKFHHHIYPNTSIFYSFYFTLTGVHALHVIGGMIPIGWMALRSANGRYTGHGNNTIEYIGIYWHFVDLVWIFLFPLLYLIR